MTEENKDEKPEGTEEETEETEGTEEETEETEEKDEKSPEFLRAIKARDRFKAENRKLKEQLAAAQKKPEDKEDPVLKANSRLVAANARAQLAAIGVTDKDDQKIVISALNLSDVDVDEDGEVDTDAIEERIGDLRRIFAAKEAENPKRRTPRTNPKDRSTGDTNSDPDAARYRRFIGGR